MIFIFKADIWIVLTKGTLFYARYARANVLNEFFADGQQGHMRVVQSTPLENGSRGSRTQCWSLGGN